MWTLHRTALLCKFLLAFFSRSRIESRRNTATPLLLPNWTVSARCSRESIIRLSRGVSVSVGILHYSARWSHVGPPGALASPLSPNKTTAEANWKLLNWSAVNHHLSFPRDPLQKKNKTKNWRLVRGVPPCPVPADRWRKGSTGPATLRAGAAVIEK